MCMYVVWVLECLSYFLSSIHYVIQCFPLDVGLLPSTHVVRVRSNVVYWIRAPNLHYIWILLIALLPYTHVTYVRYAWWWVRLGYDRFTGHRRIYFGETRAECAGGNFYFPARVAQPKSNRVILSYCRTPQAHTQTRPTERVDERTSHSKK